MDKTAETFEQMSTNLGTKADLFNPLPNFNVVVVVQFILGLIFIFLCF